MFKDGISNGAMIWLALLWSIVDVYAVFPESCKGPGAMISLILGNICLGGCGVIWLSEHLEAKAERFIRRIQDED